MVLSMPVFGQVDTLIIKDEWSNKSKVVKSNRAKNKEITFHNGKEIKSSTYRIDNSSSSSNSYDISILGKKYSKSNMYADISDNEPIIMLGLTNYMKSGSVYAPTGNGVMSLNWSNSYSMYLNPVHFGIPFSRNNSYGIVVGLGFEYQLLSFSDKHTSIQEGEDGVLIPRPINPEYDVRRNKFKKIYFNIPIILKWQVDEFHISAGASCGVSLHTKTKVVYDYEGNKHKDKNSSDFNMIPFKVDAVARLGYGSVSLFCNYTLTKMFADNIGPDLHPLTIGIGVAF